MSLLFNMEHPLHPFPSSHLSVSASSDFFLAAVSRRRQLPFPPSVPSATWWTPWTETKGVLLVQLSGKFSVFHAAPLKPSLSHSTQLSQNSQTSGCILGMPRKLLVFPEAGAGEQGHDSPSVFPMALITMTELPSLKGQQSKTAKGRICNRDQQSCKQVINTGCNIDCETLPTLKQHPRWVMPTHSGTGFSLEIQDCLTVWRFLTCTPVFLCSCKHPRQGFHALQPTTFKPADFKLHGLFFLNKQNLLAWLNSWQYTSKKTQQN